MHGKNLVIGYTTGVFDLFHIGHLNLLKNAKGMCDKLIVGVTVDDLVRYKGKNAFIPFEDRIEIVRSIRYVDAAIPQYDMDKLKACKKLGASILFVGDDWYQSEKWEQYEKELEGNGIRVVYFPYTIGISSTRINQALTQIRDKDTVNKCFCMSSYLSFRFIEKEGVDFFGGMHHKNFVPIPPEERIPVHSASEIDREIRAQMEGMKGEKLGILLSGGMDSAILASYMPGCDAYTFRFLNGAEKFNEELNRAEYYAHAYGLTLHYVDIDWQTVERYVDACMDAKCAPVHSIEPQLLQAALQAKADGCTRLVVGESSDLVFGGMDGLLKKDWTVEEFKQRYTFTRPEDVLKEPVDMSYLFERYRQGEFIDFLSFMDDVFSIESSGSYWNAFQVAGIPYTDPYAILKMADKLDLGRVRHGEPKYLVRELFSMKYPSIPVPDKIPMPRPVDEYFADWNGPKRKEFQKGLDMSRFTGNQKWQIWCLERFLNRYDHE